MKVVNTSKMQQVKTVPLTEQDALDALNSLLTGWQFLENLDAITNLSIFRHDLKRKVNLLMPELEKFVDQVEMLFDSDTEAMNNLMEHKRNLISRIGKFRPEEQAACSEVLEAYFAAPEKTKELLGITILKQ